MRQGPECPSSALQAWLEREWGSPWRETVATWRCIEDGEADKLRLDHENTAPRWSDPACHPCLTPGGNARRPVVFFSTPQTSAHEADAWVAKWLVGTEGSVCAPTPPYIETQHAVTSLHFREAGSPHIADHRRTSLHSNSHPVLAATVFSSDSSLKTAGFKSDPGKLPLGSSHRQRQSTW